MLVPSIRPPPAHPRPSNKLLACLPDADFRRIRSQLRTVALQPKQVIHARNEPIEDVLFPNGGIASMTSVMQDGAMVEIATIGKRRLCRHQRIPRGGHGGRRNDAASSGRPDHDRRGDVREGIQRGDQPPRSVFRVCAAILASPVDAHDALDGLHRISPSAAAPPPWLLMVHDRVRRDDFHLSHEFLAMMLGSTGRRSPWSPAPFRRRGSSPTSTAELPYWTGRAWNRLPVNATEP